MELNLHWEWGEQKLSKYVLFSPIGDSDPYRAGHDGSMIHIVRYYKPHKVYLYLTAEMLKKRDELIKALQPFNVEIETIDTDIIEANSYDIFEEEFSRILPKIQEENPDSEILLNITSGTPQMKSSLCLEVVTSYLSLKPIQVSSPKGDSNEGVSHGGSADDNVDSLMDGDKYLSTCRCIEPNMRSFRRSARKRDITSLVESYEYSGALRIAEKYDNLFSKEVLDLIKYASLRQNDKIAEYNKIHPWCDEFEYTKDFQAKRACDYYCLLKNKAYTGELSYFVLLLKPHAEYLAGCYLGIFDDNDVFNCLNEFYMKRNGNGYRQEKYDNRVVYNLEQYICIMEYYNKPEDMIERFKLINNSIKKRNISAHELYRVEDVDTKEFLNALKYLITKIFGNKVKENSFDVYNLMNERIISLL